jgi:hypothetical protein
MTCFIAARCSHARLVFRETNVIGMRLGPGRHLKGRTLLGGVITPEEFDHFHEVGYLRSLA